MPSDRRRPRVLVIAEAANPEWVSVPLVGWSLAKALRDITDAHIVTHARNRDAFKRAGLQEDVDFTVIDSDRVAAPLWKIAQLLRGGNGKGWTTLSAFATLSYYYFELLVWRRFRTDIKAGNFDIVHRITPLSPTTPSTMARKCKTFGVPFVLGPLNGGVPWPPSFDSARRAEKEWLSYVRGLYRLLPGLRSTYRSASLVLAGSRFTADEIARVGGTNIHYIPENAIDPKRFGWIPRLESGEVLRVCFIGRLVPYKGLDMLLEAIADLARAKLLKLDIIGSGPMQAELEALTGTLMIEDQVTFHGWVEHKLIPDIAGRSAIFGFPSIREFGGGAVLEAMALGLVPIVVNYAGPGELVNSSVGFAVELEDRQSIIVRIKSIVEALQKDPDTVRTLGKSAHAYAINNFTWSKKAESIKGLYADVIRANLVSRSKIY